MFGRLFGSRDKTKLTAQDFANGDAEGFWRWFSENADTFRAKVGMPPGELGPLLDALHLALKKYSPELVFEIGLAKDDRLDLVISADGIQGGFPAVLALHKAAPISDRFKATAFRQRQPGGSIRMGNSVLSSETVFYISDPADNGLLDVSLFVPLHAEATDRERMQMGFLILDMALGEYDVATSLGGISFHHISDAPEQARPLTELVAEVDALNAGRATN